MGDNSLADVLDKDGDDLYGPYWIATTLIVVLFIGGIINKEIGLGFLLNLKRNMIMNY